MTRRVLITGAGGFIGQHLLRACLDRGDQVVALVRPGFLTDRMPDVELKRVDLSDRDALRRVFDTSRPEVVFHAAANTRVVTRPGLKDAEASVSDNLMPLMAVLGAAATCDAPPDVFIRLGTIAEYGEVPSPYTETQCEMPRDSYGASMLAGTKYLTMLRPRVPFTAMTARLSLTYGPGQTGPQLVPYLIRTLLNGDAARIGRPDDIRDFLHVGDAVRALLMLADAPRDDVPVVNVSTGVATRVRDAAAILAELTGSGPGQLDYADPSGEPMHLVNDPGLIHSLYPWTARIGVEDGLRDTVDWATSSDAQKNLAGQNA